MRVVKAAAVQVSPILYSREGTVEKVVRKIHELGRQGCSSPRFRRPWWLITSTFRSSSPPLQNIVGPERRKLLDQAHWL